MLKALITFLEVGSSGNCGDKESLSLEGRGEGEGG